MKKISSRQLLDELASQSEFILEHVIHNWQQLPMDILSFQPSPGAWSAGECLSHLNSYGEYYLPVIEKAIGQAKAGYSQPAGLFSSGWIGNYFTHTMRTDSKGQPVMKMKSPKKHVPANAAGANVNTDVVIATFIDQQEKFLKLIDEAGSININTTRVPVSIAPFIKLKLGDIFRILVAHNYRHLKQAERALVSAGIKKSPTISPFAYPSTSSGSGISNTGLQPHK